MSIFSRNKYTKIEINSQNNSLFKRLYNNDALTKENISSEITDENLESVCKWFKSNSKSNSSNVKIYIISSKVINSYYHLTGDNRYNEDTKMICIDWNESGSKNPYKGSWRWFSDVVDNNARREIMKNNEFYNNYKSKYGNSFMNW